MPGFPIRTSSDPRSVDNSPRHIAASHVLHRLSVPRHPPCALKHLHTKQIKKFSEESKNCIITQQTTPKKRRQSIARCSQPLSTNQTPHPTTKDRATTRTPHPTPGPKADTGPHQEASAAGLLSQSPIVCLAIPHHQRFPRRLNVCRAPDPHPLQVKGHPTNRSETPDNPRSAGRPKHRGAP